MAPKNPVFCAICRTQESKYTCPTCYIVYCSVKCFKEHQEDHIPDEVPLKPLTSLKWPYIPDAPSYDDPLKRNDPKRLKLRDYEAIASSPAIRKTLTSHPNLRSLLQRVDKLRGAEREEALERLLGVSTVAFSDSAETEDDIKAMKELAEAVEICVRGDKAGALGLDWDEHT
ncbi:hypothetical protein BU17DRAFT_77702 [Hysterangium stoloniferum]|nr:hypothetical protein BU17DRAFT_77702 [Hysterangium stoloniferum]